MRRLPVADGFYAAGLTTLPLVGVGLIHALTGIDVGAGLQPSYLLLALAVVLGLHQLVPLPGGGILDALVRSNPAILSGSDWLYLQGFTDVPRLRGSMCEPLYLGSLLVGMLPLLATAGRRRLAVAGMVVLLLTWSRGAWLAAAVGLLVWWVLRRRAGLPGPSRRILITAVVGLLSVLVVVVALAGPDALAWPVRRLLQTFDRSDWSNLTRPLTLSALLSLPPAVFSGQMKRWIPRPFWAPFVNWKRKVVEKKFLRSSPISQFFLRTPQSHPWLSTLMTMARSTGYGVDPVPSVAGSGYSIPRSSHQR